MGFVQGIENYSRHLSQPQRRASRRPRCIDYFPEDFLLVIDESHQTVPQIGAMYRGDRSRKETLVEYGFRLPSALDNRPLKFEEFEKHMRRTIFVSATPGDYELAEVARAWSSSRSSGPTGLIDPEIVVRPVGGPGRRPARRDPRARRDERARARDHADQAHGRGSDRVLRASSACACATCTPTSTRSSASRSCATCARGEFDVLVGINLLREGLDLPEVSLVAILDADKEGFLRSPRSLIQTIGRAARNVNGQVFMYADRDDRRDEAARSTRRTGGARCRPSTTRSTASRRRRSSARSWTSNPASGTDRLLRGADAARRGVLGAARVRAKRAARGRRSIDRRASAARGAAAGDVRGRGEPAVRDRGAAARRDPEASGKQRNDARQRQLGSAAAPVVPPPAGTGIGAATAAPIVAPARRSRVNATAAVATFVAAARGTRVGATAAAALDSAAGAPHYDATAGVGRRADVLLARQPTAAFIAGNGGGGLAHRRPQTQAAQRRKRRAPPPLTLLCRSRTKTVGPARPGKTQPLETEAASTTSLSASATG